jgi:hypothetical protein
VVTSQTGIVMSKRIQRFLDTERNRRNEMTLVWHFSLNAIKIACLRLFDKLFMLTNIMRHITKGQGPEDQREWLR